ncbi:gamma-glutamylcyclotransferase family protein [Ideonella sp. DXS29W]|uniref:Gamma-glutamylcyclotransferase family protein n=1 Tax=Ideonella lacteola TaxID=2984193 RepID=A0ABU9C1A5_9BURK
MSALGGFIMSALIFVYGTLKQGFPNFHLNPGQRVPGQFRTIDALPLYVVQLPHEDRAPWLMQAPGQGHQVIGQVFQVDDATLRSMDRFEEVGQPTGYVRCEVRLEAIDASGEVLRAQAYLKPVEQMRDCLAVEGPFAEYTLELCEGYRLVWPGQPPTEPG